MGRHSIGGSDISKTPIIGEQHRSSVPSEEKREDVRNRGGFGASVCRDEDHGFADSSTREFTDLDAPFGEVPGLNTVAVVAGELGRHHVGGEHLERKAAE